MGAVAAGASTVEHCQKLVMTCSRRLSFFMKLVDGTDIRVGQTIMYCKDAGNPDFLNRDGFYSWDNDPEGFAKFDERNLNDSRAGPARQQPSGVTADTDIPFPGEGDSVQNLSSALADVYSDEHSEAVRMRLNTFRL